MEWKPVVGFESYYLVSENGDVYSMRKQRLLSPKVDKYGYAVVTLSFGEQHKCTGVHRLVAQAFIPNSYNKKTVNHKDENKLNNNVHNLEWATSKENANYGTRNSRMAKTKCRRAVIALYINGNTERFDGVKAASRSSGIAHSQISKCCKGLIANTHGITWRYADDMA